MLHYVPDGFHGLSSEGTMDGRVKAMDVFLLQILTPHHSEAGNVPAFYSGHYCAMGVNVGHL